MKPAYRKLPGHRRGFLQGASLWMAPDHLLSVKSLRFREEYKRFHWSDIQAIVVADGPRFHISTLDATVMLAWLVLYFAVRDRAPWAPIVLWIAGAALAVAWLYISSAHSCTCRIYTAVSREKLPSIYRTWTARKFLAAVEPRIREVQGAIDPGWAERSPALRPAAVPSLASAAPTQNTGRTHTLASDLFVASLFADVALNLLTLRSESRPVQWMMYGLAMVEIVGASVIFLQHYRGILRSGMQKLAIATLIGMGVSFYVRQIVTSVAMGNSPITEASLTQLPSYVVLRQADAGLCLVLGLVGVVLIFTPRRDPA